MPEAAVAGYKLAAHPIRGAAVCQIDAGRHRGRHGAEVDEESIRVSQALVKRVREVRKVQIDVPPGRADTDELFRRPDGQSTQEKRVDKGE